VIGRAETPTGEQPQRSSVSAHRCSWAVSWYPWPVRLPPRAQASARTGIYAQAARLVGPRRARLAVAPHRDPYRVLVSEFMLQQTQVSRVAEYYPRFLERFPDLDTLARARPRAVREAWDGLGYYARASNLHSLARVVSRDHGGKLPDVPEELVKLRALVHTRREPWRHLLTRNPSQRRYQRRQGATARFRERGTRNAERELWRLASMLVPKNGKRA